GDGAQSSTEVAFDKPIEKLVIEDIHLAPGSPKLRVTFYKSSEGRAVLNADSNILGDFKLIYSSGKLTVRSKQRRLYSSELLSLDIYLPESENLSIAVKTSAELKSEGSLNAKALLLEVFGSVKGELELETQSADISIGGAGEILLKGETDALNVNISGAANLNAKELLANKVSITSAGSSNLQATAKSSLKAEITGTGNLGLYGEVETLNIKISGFGEVNASELKAKEAVLKIAGSGKADLDVSDKLDVEISGSGFVDYSGSPSITERISGFGKVNAK
ncbi:MAG TPA: DUF2807 domain-containing protein, partial [Clostridia bacterium]|nr:DUF2807 domain-containing protein [Clostridia bacterium]